MSKYTGKVNPNRVDIDKKIHAGMTKEELAELKAIVIKYLREGKTVKASPKVNLNYIEVCAEKLLNNYDSMEDKEATLTILEAIGNHIIEKKGATATELTDLNDLDKSYRREAELLRKIHAKTLIEGNSQIPANFSKKYFDEMILIHGFNAPTLIEDAEVVSFIRKLGESEFAMEKPEDFKGIVEDFIMYPLQNLADPAGNPRISQNSDLLRISIQYLRSLDESKTADIDMKLLVSTIRKVFGSYIETLSPKEREVLEEDFNKYSGFVYRALTKDITEYASYEEFMRDAGLVSTVVEQDPVEEHDTDPRPREHQNENQDNVMSNEDKFKAIQDAVENLREVNPRISVGPLLVGVQPPFTNYVLFPLQNRTEMVVEGNPTSGSNLVFSEVFNNTRGGALYIMTKQNADYVFSFTDPNNPGTNNGPATRTSAKSNRPGVVTIHHYTGDGYFGYLTMVLQALNTIRQNPDANREYRRTNDRMMELFADYNHRGLRTNTNPLDLIVDIDELRRVPADATQHNNYVDSRISTLKTKYQDKKGAEGAEEFKLLDYVLEEIFINGRSHSEICQEIADTYGVDKQQAIAYVRGTAQGISRLDPTHATELLKKLYTNEINRLNQEVRSMKMDAADRVNRIRQLEKSREELSELYGGR